MLYLCFFLRIFRRQEVRSETRNCWQEERCSSRGSRGRHRLIPLLQTASIKKHLINLSRVTSKRYQC